MFTVFFDELRPAMRQSVEEVMVDIANIIAEEVKPDFIAGNISQSQFADSIEAFKKRKFNAEIWGLKKDDSNIRIYITDAQGVVLYDSSGLDIGADYSRWRDVRLTLQGEYGARTSRIDENDPLSSVMYVAAPIQHQGEILGVLTVAKPNISVQPFIEMGRRRLMNQSVWLFFGALLVGLVLTVLLTHSIRQLLNYTKALGRGERVKLPKIREPELAMLGESIASMRKQLEGKEYVERYVHTLTHEMKSPLSAIHGATELLQEPMAEQQQKKFLDNIATESQRLQQFVEKMLDLVAVEKRDALEAPEVISLAELIQEVVDGYSSRAGDRKLQFKLSLAEDLNILGERFLLRQAISNLLDNAITFSPQDTEISIRLSRKADSIELEITDQGPGIPDYAINRVFERFYALAVPGMDKKSSGIGLSFVKEVITLHGGNIEIKNYYKASNKQSKPDGVQVSVILSAHSKNT